MAKNSNSTPKVLPDLTQTALQDGQVDDAINAQEASVEAPKVATVAVEASKVADAIRRLYIPAKDWAAYVARLAKAPKGGAHLTAVIVSVPKFADGNKEGRLWFNKPLSYIAQDEQGRPYVDLAKCGRALGPETMEHLKAYVVESAPMAATASDASAS